MLIDILNRYGMWYQQAFRIILIFFSCLPIFPVNAQTIVEAEGMARVEPDITISRDLAVLRAKQQALETLGVGITSRNIAAQGKMLDEMIMIQTSGFVERHDILEEGEEIGYYHVRLRAWVKTGKALDEAYSSVFRERIVSISAKGEGSEHVEGLLRKDLAGRFYHVLEYDNKTLMPDFKILVDSSAKSHSDFAGIRSFCTDASISMVQVSVGRQVIYVVPGKPIIVYGKDLDQALGGRTANQYPKKVAGPLVNSFLNELTSLENRHSRTIRLTISGLPDMEAFRAFRDYVKNVRLGMEGLYGENYDNGRGTLDVSYREKSLYLATIIGYRPQYKIIGHQWDGIQVVYADRSN